MDVSTGITAAVSHLAAVSSASTTTERVEAPPPPPEQAASTQLSRTGRLISKLSQLRDSAPEQFRQAVSNIASELRSVSEKDSGMGATLLVDLANELDRAASDAERSAAAPSSSTDAEVSSGQTDLDGRGATGESTPREPASRAAVEAYRRAAAAAEPRGRPSASPG
jgi:hypothetical protein